ncbi:MAG: 3D domain-containing protein, partial [Candidatus Peregrinibacteria bacterium]|nr:3D domain-containing protein [Candidatus Peregrinibacteria bacterium]
MKALKVFTTAFAVLAQLALVAAPAFATGGETRKLLVTAYYSPLPNQTFYIKGSYEADIRLNGRGTNGADGTEVYMGMLAAPKTYPFGTRVSIPGLGVGEVHDRGGAILPYKDYDRIDVWMGHGEEGLSRALNWGARMVYGDVYFTPHQVEPGLSYYSVNPELPGSVEARLTANSVTLQSPTTIDKPISETSSSADIT